jgi:hypothetical protein
LPPTPAPPTPAPPTPAPAPPTPPTASPTFAGTAGSIASLSASQQAVIAAMPDYRRQQWLSAPSAIQLKSAGFSLPPTPAPPAGTHAASGSAMVAPAGQAALGTEHTAVEQQQQQQEEESRANDVTWSVYGLGVTMLTMLVVVALIGVRRRLLTSHTLEQELASVDDDALARPSTSSTGSPRSARGSAAHVAWDARGADAGDTWSIRRATLRAAQNAISIDIIQCANYPV